MLQRLLDGERVIVRTWRGGLDTLARLREAMDPPGVQAPRPQRRAFKARFEAAAARLVAPVAEGRVALPDGPRIGFLDTPGLRSMLELQRMERAWGVHVKGAHLPVLGATLHPWWGTYVPRRTEHLELFATWLKEHPGPGRAIDVGTGCGVLAFLLAKAGYRTLATDINEGAVRSVRDDAERLDLRVTPRKADLLGGCSPVDLVVFNPPWTPGEVVDALDAAHSYPDDLFPRFFEQAAAALKPEGRVVLIFSNLLRLVLPDAPHPIEVELQGDRFTLVDKRQRRVKGPTKEKVEVWELAAS